MQDTARAEHFAAELLREIESLNDNSPKDNTNSKKKNQKLKTKKK